MGNQLVVGDNVRVEAISDELECVSALGSDGRNHFSTYRCLEKVLIDKEKARKPNCLPNPQWYNRQRFHKRMHVLLLRVAAVVEHHIDHLPSPLCREESIDLNKCMKEILSDATYAGRVLRHSLQRGIKYLQSVEVRRETTTLSTLSLLKECESLMSHLYSSGFLVSANAPLSKYAPGEEVVVKIFSHTETCSKTQLKRLLVLMIEMSYQLELVDELRRSSSSLPIPFNFVFYTFPVEARSVLAAGGSSVQRENLLSAPCAEGESKLTLEISTIFPKHVYLKRAYLGKSLVERLESRPYCCITDRLFIAFQLLKAVECMHEQYGVTHGDIKPSNVFVQSNGWLLLADFAPYKPALLPLDRLALFEYFYDSEDNHVCYVAPEKFVTYQPLIDDEEFAFGYFKKGDVTPRHSKSRCGGLHKRSLSMSSQRSSWSETPGAVTGYSISNINIHGHSATMDMFSVGCVLVYIFSEEHPFSLADVLKLREFFCDPFQENFEEGKKLVYSMLHGKRRRGFFSSEYPLEKHNGVNTSASNSILAAGTEDQHFKVAKDSEKSEEESSVSKIISLISRLIAVSAEHRASAGNLLNDFTPSIFPCFFDYLYEHILPQILTKDPDQQLHYFLEKLPDIQDKCLAEVIRLGSVFAKPFVVQYQVLVVLLPSFLTALRCAATQKAIFAGLQTLQQYMLPWMPLHNQVTMVLPHVLYLVHHPHEYSGLCRVRAWQVVFCIAKSWTAHILQQERLDEKTLALLPTPFKDEILRSYIEPLDLVLKDPYNSSSFMVESGTLFDSLIIPAVLSCFSEESVFSSTLVQDDVVLAEVASMAPFFFLMAQFTINWQHNFIYSNASDYVARSKSDESMPEMREKKTEAQDSSGWRGKNEALSSLWHSHFSRRAMLIQLGGKLLDGLIHHQKALVSEITMKHIDVWIRFFGREKTKQYVFPSLQKTLCSFAAQTAPLTRSASDLGTCDHCNSQWNYTLSFFYYSIKAFSLAEVLGEDSVSDAFRETAAGFFELLYSFVYAGLQRENDPALLCIVLDSFLCFLQQEKALRITMNVQASRDLFALRNQLYDSHILRISRLAVPFLGYASSLHVAFASSGVIVAVAETLKNKDILVKFCSFVLPLLSEPLPILLLQSLFACSQNQSSGTGGPYNLISSEHLIFPSPDTQNSATDRCFQLINHCASHQEENQVQTFSKRVLQMPLILRALEESSSLLSLKRSAFRLYLPISSRVRLRKALVMPPLPKKSPAGSVVRYSSSPLSKAPSSGSPSSCSPSRPKLSFSLSINDRLLATLRPTGIPVLTHSLNRDASIYCAFGVGNRKIFCAGSKGFAAVLEWNLEGCEKTEDDRAISFESLPRQSSELYGNTQRFGYRSHHTLSTKTNYAWCGGCLPGEVERASLLPLETPSTVPDSLLASFRSIHCTYTSAQMIHAHPQDSLASITNPTSLVVLGSSLGTVSVIDLESNNVVGSSKAETEDALPYSVTSMAAIQSGVMLCTSSNGCVGIHDFRAPFAKKMVWSTKLELHRFGVLTSSCALFNGSTQAFGAVVGTNCGACQLIDLRYPLPVQNFWLQALTDSSNPRKRYVSAEKEDAWNSTIAWQCPHFLSTDLCSSPTCQGAKNFIDLGDREPWHIGQIHRDPMNTLFDTGNAQWVLLTTGSGTVYRMNLVTGECHEALVPSQRKGSPVGPGHQRLWLPPSKGAEGHSSQCKENAGVSRCSSNVFRLFSGGSDGRLRQWALQDVVASFRDCEKQGAESPPPQSPRAPSASLSKNGGREIDSVSQYSGTIQPFPHASPPYYIRLSSASSVKEDKRRKASPHETGLAPTGFSLVEDGQWESHADMKDYSASPPCHQEAITALGTVMGNEFVDSASSLCLFSCSQDGVLKIWRNR